MPILVEVVVPIAEEIGVEEVPLEESAVHDGDQLREIHRDSNIIHSNIGACRCRNSEVN